jgi:hypothetical protein
VSQPKLDAVRISYEDLGSLLFCNVETHSRVCYAERIQAIWQDLLNGGHQFGKEGIGHSQPADVSEAEGPHFGGISTATTLEVPIDEQKTVLSQDNDIDEFFSLYGTFE